MVKMAEASGVPIEWLATGKGTPNGSLEQKRPTQDSLSQQEAGFTERLRETHAIIKRSFGLMPIESPLSTERLNELLGGARPNFEDIVGLSRYPLLPLNYVLSGHKDREENRKNTSNEYAFASLIQKLRAIDDKRRVADWTCLPSEEKKFPPSWQEPLFELVARLYERLEPKNLLLHAVMDDALSSSLPQGTLVIAVREKSPSRPGLYVMSYQQMTKDPQESAFVARVSLGESGLVASFDNNGPDNGPHRSLDVGKLNTLGRVILTVRLSGT